MTVILWSFYHQTFFIYYLKIPDYPLYCSHDGAHEGSKNHHRLWQGISFHAFHSPFIMDLSFSLLNWLVMNPRFNQPLSWKSLNLMFFALLCFICQPTFVLAFHYSKACRCAIAISVQAFTKLAHWKRTLNLAWDVECHVIFNIYTMAPNLEIVT